MSDETSMPDRSDDDALAAEYVLGVLDEADRATCAERIARDPGFASLVANWEQRLAGMNEGFVEAAPPASVKAALDQRLFSEPEPPVRTGLWSSLGFWRGLAGAAIAGLAVLAIILATEPQPSSETLVAALASADSDARFVALYEPASNSLRVTRVAGEQPTDRDFELWLIAGDSAPVSLGLVGAEGDRAPSVVATLQDAFAEGATLAVSVEPVGGSTTGAPTGPVVASGPVKRI